MNALFSDPIVLICGGAILIGLVVLVWLVGKLFSSGKSKAMEDDLGLGDLSSTNDAEAETDLPPLELGDEEPVLAPPPPPPPSIKPKAPVAAPISPMPVATPAPAPAPAINKEVVTRLETMTQKLAEMQSVLTKQAAAAPVAAGAPGSNPIGQGFSPDTIDKLLKIIGNVMQQVDILQKSINTGEAPKAGGESSFKP